MISANRAGFAEKTFHFCFLIKGRFIGFVGPFPAGEG